MKKFRGLLIAIAILIGLVLIVPQLITLNQFKTLAAQKVEVATGRKLDIAGDIHLSLFPVLGAKVEKISLSNVKGAENPQMASIEQANIGVKLAPLFKGEVVLDKIILKKPVIYLQKDINGKGNWEFPKQENAAAEAQAGNAPARKLTLGGVSISEGTVIYHDMQSGQSVELAQVNAEASLTDMDRPAALKASAQWKGVPVKLMLATGSPSALMSEKGSDIKMEISAYGIEGGLSGQVAMTEKHIAVSNLLVEMGDTVGKGNLDLVLGGQVPVVNAKLAFGSINLEPLMALGAANNAAGGNAATGKPAAVKNGLVDAAAFASVDGTFDLSADFISTKAWQLAKAQVVAQLKGGGAAVKAEGIFTAEGQEPVAFALTSGEVPAILSGRGGGFAAQGKRGNLNAKAQGNLAVGANKVNWQNAVLKLNDQTMQGRIMADFGGDKPKVDAALVFDVLDVEKLKALAGPTKAANDNKATAAAKTEAAPDLSFIHTLDAAVNVKAGTLVAGGQRVSNFALNADTGSEGLKASVSGNWQKSDQNWRFEADSPRTEKLVTKEGAPMVLDLQSAGQHLKLAGTLSYVGGVATLSPFTLVSNGGQGSGKLLYNGSGAKPSLNASMQFDSLDLNPLLALAGDGKPDKPQAAATPETAKTGSPLDTMDAKLHFTANKLKVKEIVATDASLDMNLQNGNLTLEVPGVGLYGGRASLKANVQGQAFNAALMGSHVDLGALLKGGAGTSAFQGIGDWDMQVAGNGLEAPALYQAMSGKGSFAINDMVISGFDILTVASQIRGLSSKSVVTQDRSSNKMNTKGTFTMQNGVARNDDLEATGPNLQMKGAGEINLPAWTINFRLEPKLGETRKNAAGEEKFVGTQVPVLIDGSLTQPRVYPDPKALIGTGLDALKSVKELGIGKKVQGLDKFLTPLGIGGGNTAPQPAPVTPENTTPAAPVVVPDQNTTQPRKNDPGEQIQQLKQLFGR